MKISRWSQLVLMFGLVAALAHGARADTHANVIAVVNRAAWCSVCKANGERAGKVLMAAAHDGTLVVVVNDLTDDKTTRASADMLKAAGVDKAMAPYMAVGVVYLFDATSKRALRQITIANTDQEISMAIAVARKEASH